MNKTYTDSEYTIDVQDIAHHRNGIGGEPFYAILFTDQEQPGNRFVATVCDGKGCVAVLEIGKLARGNIKFGENSWRGDVYECVLRMAIKEYEAS